MNLWSIINPQDLGGVIHAPAASSSNASSVAVLDLDTETRRSARTRYRPPLKSSDTTSSDLPRSNSGNGSYVGKAKGAKGKAKTVRSRPAALSGSGRSTLVGVNGVKKRRTREARTQSTDPRIVNHRRDKARPAHRHTQPRLSAAQELVRRARAAADHTSPTGSRRPQSIMDVILNAQTPNNRLYVEDLADAIDECYRVALSAPASDADEVLADMFVPGRYEARQAALAEGSIHALPEVFSSNEIYHVSAERSTATWDPSLDSDDNASMESQSDYTQSTTS